MKEFWIILEMKEVWKFQFLGLFCYCVQYDASIWHRCVDCTDRVIRFFLLNWVSAAD